MRIHPAAKSIPEMLPDDFAGIKADIEARGLIVPIETYDGQLLDGRHRLRACQELGIEPRTLEVDLNGMSPAEYVWSVNGARRHLTASQKAAVAVEMLPELEKAAKERQGTRTDLEHSGKNSGMLDSGEARKKAAALVGVNPHYVSDAARIKKESPRLFDEIKSGEKTIVDARKQERKERQAANEAKLAAKVGDCVDWRVTDDQSVIQCDVVITDPPYGILDEPWEPSDREAVTRAWLNRWNDCNAGLILSFFSQRHMWDARRWFDECLDNYAFQQMFVWHYPNNIKQRSRKWAKLTWEPIFVYRRKGSEKKIGVYGTEWGNGLNGFDCHVAAVPQSNFNGVDCKIHPAQKPVSVMRWLVNATTQQGDLVADPFCGSGTTGIAAQQLNRRFHGIETDGDMAEIAQRRIKAYGVQ